MLSNVFRSGPEFPVNNTRMSLVANRRTSGSCPLKALFKHPQSGLKHLGTIFGLKNHENVHAFNFFLMSARNKEFSVGHATRT